MKTATPRGKDARTTDYSITESLIYAIHRPYILPHRYLILGNKYGFLHSFFTSKNLISFKNVNLNTNHPRISYTWVSALWIGFSNCPTRCDLYSSLVSCRQLYVFRVLTPFIRSSYNCNYRFWYWLTAVSKMCCY